MPDRPEPGIVQYSQNNTARVYKQRYTEPLPAKSTRLSVKLTSCRVVGSSI